MEANADITGFFLEYAKQAPLISAAMMVCVGAFMALLARQSFYAWYFAVLVAVLLISDVLKNPLAFCVFLLGGVAGLAEFIGKFRDEPLKALRTAQAITYLSFNGFIAVFAYTLMVAYGAQTGTLLDEIKVVVIAGLGSMLVMRSRLFNVKLGEEDYAFGPDQIIKVYLRFMEKAIDRVRAEDRYNKVTKVMEGIKFEAVYSHAIVALDSAQVIGEDERKALVAAIDGVKKDGTLDSQQKSHRLGYLVLDEMGEDFLETIFKNVPLSMRLHAPLPTDGLLQKIPLLATRTENYMAFASNMSFERLCGRLGWTDVDAQKIRAAIDGQKCELRGYRIVFNAYDPTKPDGAFANLAIDPEGTVEGVMYKLTPDAINFLDATETAYRKVDVSPLVGGKPVKACAFVAKLTRTEYKPKPEYISFLVQAARESGLSDKYISELKASAESAPASDATLRAA